MTEKAEHKAMAATTKRFDAAIDSLARLLGPHRSRDVDETRDRLRELFVAAWELWDRREPPAGIEVDAIEVPRDMTKAPSYEFDKAPGGKPLDCQGVSLDAGVGKADVREKRGGKP